VLTVRAQVYVLNPETSNWAAASSGPVNVTMLYDPNTNNTRVVAVENSNVRAIPRARCFGRRRGRRGTC